MARTELPEERSARHLRMLRELAEIGMELAREVRRQALEQPPIDPSVSDPAVPDPARGRALTDLGLVFSRIARSVRQTMALEASVEQDRVLRQIRNGGGHRPFTMPAPPIVSDAVRRKDEVRDIVEQAIEAEAAEGDVERLLADLHERLEDPDDFAGFANRPLADLVAQICRDLGVPFDPTAWEGEDSSLLPAGEGGAHPQGGRMRVKDLDGVTPHPPAALQRAPPSP